MSERKSYSKENIPVKVGDDLLNYNHEILKLSRVAKENSKLIAELGGKNVDIIIESGSRDCSYIENTLDSLLDAMMFNEGKESYLKLLNYYNDIDSDGFDFYSNAALEYFRED